jgi:hypothetical protein
MPFVTFTARRGLSATDKSRLSEAMLEAQVAAGSSNVCCGSRLCENAKAINRDRTTYSFKIVLGAHTQGHSAFGANASKAERFRPSKCFPVCTSKQTQYRP